MMVRHYNEFPENVIFFSNLLGEISTFEKRGGRVNRQTDGQTNGRMDT
jgi:hypothetical protein